MVIGLPPCVIPWLVETGFPCLDQTGDPHSSYLYQNGLPCFCTVISVLPEKIGFLELATSNGRTGESSPRIVCNDTFHFLVTINGDQEIKTWVIPTAAGTSRPTNNR